MKGDKGLDGIGQGLELDKSHELLMGGGGRLLLVATTTLEELEEDRGDPNRLKKLHKKSLAVLMRASEIRHVKDSTRRLYNV